MRSFGILILILTLCGCNSAPINPVTAAVLNAGATHPITCTAGPECDVKWSRASSWVAQNAAFKIQTSSDTIIQTMGPLRNDDRLAYTVTKAATSLGAYDIHFSAGCDNIFECTPSTEMARIAFFAFVNGATPPPNVKHEGATLGAQLLPVAPGTAQALGLDADRGMIVVSIVPGSLAEKSGIEKGDVLLSMDGQPVNNEALMVEAFNAAAARHKAVMQFLRSGTQRTLTIPI